MQDVKDYIDKYKSLLALSKSISLPDAERRASMFLEAMATLTDWKHVFSESKIKLISIQTAVYAEQMSKGLGKTMTQDKIAAEASKEYETAREELERLENDISYIKAYYDIFKDGHLFYRQMAKGESL